MMSITVIIPTYNGESKILNAIRSLENQSLIPSQVIIVVDGSTDNTITLLKKEKFNFPKFKIIEQENLGRAQVRNRGSNEAESELLVFLDDDMTVPKQWLENHCSHHQRHPNTLMTGYLEEPHNKPDNEIYKYFRWLNSKWYRNFNHLDESSALLTYPYLSAGNFSIKKNLFFDLGGFDANLNDLEDKDLAIRAQANKHELYLCKNAFAYHNDTHSTSFKKYIKRLREYETAHQKLIKIKPEIYLDTNINKQLHTKNPIKITIFRFFSTRLWVNALEKGYLVWLPLELRFKVYDIIITANSKIFPKKVRID